jgi:hypothetical protein
MTVTSSSSTSKRANTKWMIVDSSPVAVPWDAILRLLSMGFVLPMML